MHTCHHGNKTVNPAQPPAIDSAFKVSLVGNPCYLKRHDCLACVHVLDRLFSDVEHIFFVLSQCSAIGTNPRGMVQYKYSNFTIQAYL